VHRDGPQGKWGIDRVPCLDGMSSRIAAEADEAATRLLQTGPPLRDTIAVSTQTCKIGPSNKGGRHEH